MCIAKLAISNANILITSIAVGTKCIPISFFKIELDIDVPTPMPKKNIVSNSMKADASQ